MAPHTPLSDLAGGAQRYFRLTSEVMRLRAHLGATDIALGTLRNGVTAALCAFFLFFTGIALALFLGGFIGAPAAFAVTGTLFLAAIPVVSRIFKRHAHRLRNRIFTGMGADAGSLPQAKARYEEARAELEEVKRQLDQQFQQVKETTARLEAILNPADGEKSGSAARSVAGRAAGALVRHALLPRAGAAGGLVAPLIAGVLARPSTVKKLVRGAAAFFTRK